MTEGLGPRVRSSDAVSECPFDLSEVVSSPEFSFDFGSNNSTL